MKTAIVFILFFSPLLSENFLDKSPFNEIPNDLHNYFSKKTFIPLFSAFTLGGAIANSPMDQKIYDFYQKQIRTDNTDAFLTFWKKMGQDELIIAYGGLTLFSFAGENSKVGSFSKHLLFNSLRAFTIGGIPLQLARLLTGGNRPIYTNKSSYWEPLTSPRGVSGHTYTGAILFITWAKMVDGISYKGLLYGLSTLTGISRVNDGFHYPSQVFLGWMMAYVACDAVMHTNSNYHLSLTPDGASLSFEF